uniref:Uncharacterized protein n=1 Tax=Romanomermis culicivorax TaxID=13658 RepID=A0A915J9T7_ROMCU
MPANNLALDRTTLAEVPPISAASATANLLMPRSSGQNYAITAPTYARASAVSQIPLPSTAVHSNNDPIVARTESSDSFINSDPRQVPTATRAPVTNHCSSLAIANANKVHNFGIEAQDDLEQLSTGAA